MYVSVFFKTGAIKSVSVRAVRLILLEAQI